MTELPRIKLTKPQAETEAEKMPEIQAEEGTSQSQADSTYSDNDTSHIDNIEIEEDGGEGAEEFNHAENVGINPDGTMTRETFNATFNGVFNISSALTRLESLKIAEGDPSAEMASNAIYDTASEVDALRFLIMPSNVWIQRSVCILSFLAPKCIMIEQELNARQAKNVTPKEESV